MPPAHKAPNTPEPAPGKLLPRWKTKDHWAILQVGYWVVPDYSFEEAARGLSDDDIQRELLLSWAHSKGKRVYPEFSKRQHVATEAIPYDPSRPLHIGWDWATCYSDDTEVLTENGWKLFRDVDIDVDRIATRNPANGALEYHAATFKVEYDYNGDLLEWRHRSLSLLVTPDHMMPVTRDDKRSDVMFRSAEDMERHNTGHFYVDTTSTWNPADWHRAMFGMSDVTFAEFMALYLSEGSLDKANGRYYRITIAQKARDERLEAILQKTGRNWVWFGYGWRTCDPELAAYLQQFGHAPQKHVPSEIKAMPRDVIRRFIEVYTIGDGSMKTVPCGNIVHRISTSSKRMADDLQELVQKAGWNATVRPRNPQNSTIREKGGTRVIRNNGGYEIRVRHTVSRAILSREHFRRVPYSGKVYCVNVPNHVIYVRREGIASWNGNCPSCVISQLNVYSQWCILSCVVADEDRSTSIYEFGEAVARHLRETYALPHGVELDDLAMVHIGDPSGQSLPVRVGDASPKAGTPKEIRSAFDIMKDGIELFMGEDGRGQPKVETRGGWGWRVIPGAVSLTERLEAVKSRLRMLVGDGYPAFVVDPGCNLVIEAMSGGYHYHQRTDGRYELDPYKDVHCVPDTYDALTPTGWKRHDELAVGDPIYVYDKDKDRLRVGVVRAVNVYDGDIECLRFRGHSFEMTVTPNHKCLARRRSVARGVYERYDPLGFVSADTLHSGHYLLTSTSLDGPGKPKAHFSDDLVRLCAWVMAEGTYRKTQGAILLVQSISHNPEYVQQLDALLSRFQGVTRHADAAGSNMATWRIGRETAWLLRQLMPDKIVSLETIANMSTAQMRLFLYEYIRADGSWQRGKYGPLPEKIEIRRERDFWVRSECPEVGQKSYAAVERLQIMATLCGMVSRVYRSSNEQRWVLTLSKRPKHGVSVARLRRETVMCRRVWCPTTDAGTWVTRDNGRPFITGNSDVADALGYIATRLDAAPPKREEETVSPRQPFRSHAADRRRY